jgi:hypothetical protein
MKEHPSHIGETLADLIVRESLEAAAVSRANATEVVCVCCASSIKVRPDLR